MKQSMVPEVLFVIIIVLLLSSAASARELLKVSTSRYSVYAPWNITTNYSFNLSGSFTAFALLLDNGSPVNGTNITFEIYANGTKKDPALYNLTQQNGLASVSYNTFGQFTDRNDTTYGNWTIIAYKTGNSAVTDRTNMSIENWRNTNATTCGSRDLCHELIVIRTGSNNGTGGNYPHSPYTGGYGNDSTYAEAAHKRSTHSSNSYRGCYICHPGYSANKTGYYGSTNDVHKNRTCDFCHGNWTYIRNNLTDPYPGGQGIPKIPSCYDCHPVNNSNPSGISTLANLTPGTGDNANVTGVNVSVYSYNFDTKTPLTAHNGTNYSLISSVPCIVCHGPAHNNTKPDPALANTNAITESSQCTSCHDSRHGRETNCTGCHSQDAHIITKPAGLDNCDLCHSIYGSAVNSSKHNKTNNIAAPDCTLCHTSYNSTDSGHSGFIVNESNTCRGSGCHEQNVSGFYERHTSTSDCTTCHFANTTQTFTLNASLFSHDHNLTIEHNFYEYNISGMPLASNLNAGVGIFPYYSCTLPCHSTRTDVETPASNWLLSAHAQARESSYSNAYCASCHSPTQRNASASSGNRSSYPIAESEWKGVQCRICHNLHDRKYPNNTGPSGWPVAYYNSTLSSLAGYSVYDTVANATVLCENCHMGSHREISYGGNHRTSLNFTCISCHGNSTFNNQSHLFEVKNTTSGVTGCEVCHNTADHTWPFTSIHIDNVTCEACHDQKFVVNATNFSVYTNGISSNDFGLYKNSTTNKWTIYKISSSAPKSWSLHNMSKSVNCTKCHNAYSPWNGITRGDVLIASGFSACTDCHSSYGAAVNSSNHNRTRNTSAPDCTDCHSGYEPNYGHTSGNKGFTVNESNTCTVTCHINGTARLTERHTSTSDCTQCHFANTTRPFDLNTSLYAHDHNLTVEHSFYEYNISGMPLQSNNGTGTGMFPYYSCMSSSCHSNGKIDTAASEWLQSKHARSREGSSDGNAYCARCKSPTQYNLSAAYSNKSSYSIAESEWQGIQCRICHNIHNRKMSSSLGGAPLGYYNSTSSAAAGYPVYEAVPNSTVLCENCHTDTNGRYYGGYHKVTLGFTCTSCHGNSTFNNETHLFEVKNTASGVAGCEVCHDEADHTWSFTSVHRDNVTCEACHDQKFVVNATNFSVYTNGISSNDYGLYKNSTTNKWTIYKISSGVPKTWSLHNISRSVNCSKCHNAYSPYNGTAREDVLIAGNISIIVDCISCHDIGGSAPKLVDFAALNNSKSVHQTINFNDSTAISRNNSRCWGCHGDGDGSEASQPVNDHPINYNNPKNCNDNDCHSISQSKYNETMVYSHFKNASLNNNPNNATNYNITTTEQCQNCHKNSLVIEDGNTNLARVSHYGSNDDLLDSFNCVYCHLDKDNGEKWGNATLINKNRTGLVSLEREKNTFKLSEGESIYLGEGYTLKLVEISLKREEAFIQLFENDDVVDETSFSPDKQYIYEKDIIIDNSTLRTPVVTLNITSIFKGNSGGFIQFNGSIQRRIHADGESYNSACYACHLYRYSEKKERYRVIDKGTQIFTDDEMIYYTKVLTDFKIENKSKIYFNDDDYIFNQLENNSGKYISFPNKQKYLAEGETWNISDNFILKLNEVSTDSKLAWLTLMINNRIVKDEAVSIGQEFQYTPGLRYKELSENNITLFSANITGVFQGKKNFILLNDVIALSPQILESKVDTPLFGYNASWLKINDTFTIGRIPPTLHSPNLFDDTGNWADCVRCHDISKNLRIPMIDAISSGLGKHSILNQGASNSRYLSNSIDRACWACHSDGKEPQAHPAGNIAPKNCQSCHVYQKEPFYGAKSISNEPHSSLSGCESCHTSGSHIIIRPPVSPAIDSAALSGSRIKKGETVELIAKAKGGYGMKIRSVEYFIDTKGTPGNGRPLKPVDGAFDSQAEQVAANISTENISAGAHVIYIHAMERANRWGDYYSVNFSIVSNESDSVQPFQRISSLIKRIPAFNGILMLISIITAYILILNRGRK
ncbi:MAG TPA: S-layer protein domain-containing protein [Candidatus Methanoperedens sp.]